MDEPERDEAERLLSAPADAVELPGGLWRAEKGGLVGVGTTRAEAVRDLADKLWVSVSRPRE